MELTPKESKRFDQLSKKNKKGILRGREKEEYNNLLKKKEMGLPPVGNDNAELPKEVSSEKNDKNAPAETEKPTFTITVDSAEKRDAILSALNDIESYRDAEKAKIDSECQKRREQEEEKIREEAQTKADDEYQKIIDEAKVKATTIENEAKEKSEQEARKTIDKTNNELKAAEDKHLKYTKMLAEITAQKDNYRHEALKEVEEQINKMASEREELIAKISEYTSEFDKLSREKQELENDLNEYELSFEKMSETQSKYTALKLEKEYIEDQYSELEKHFKEKSDEVRKLSNKIIELGDNPEEVHARMVYLESQIEVLETQLEKYPANWETIVQRSTELDTFKDKLKDVNEKNKELNKQILELQLEQAELEKDKLIVDTLKSQRDELKAELEEIREQYENHSGKIFADLLEIEKHSDEFAHHAHQIINLKKLCEDFRAYLNCRGDDKTSNKTSLYYDARTIRTFIAGFASSKTMILEGLSGTGKTSLPLAFADFMGSTTNVVAVQASWKDKNDLLGFYNDFKKQYVETDFLKYLYRAACDSNNIHIIVLDEMNLSRVEYYFADILSKLQLSDDSERTITLISNAVGVGGPKESWPSRIHNGMLDIPDNVWFVGTANKDDSTFTITDKVYDRSVVISFDSKGIRDKSLTYVGPNAITFEDFNNALKEATWSKKGDDRKNFDLAIARLDELLKPFEITFGNRIYRQLEKFVPAYIACGGNMNEAIDVMFSLKIIRKLEGLYDDKTKSNLQQLEMKLAGMPLSQERVRILRSRIA